MALGRRTMACQRCWPRQAATGPSEATLLAAARCCPLLLLLLPQKGYAWWETAAVMGTQTALVVFNCWFLVASWRRVR
jgi:hypothetical protein